MNNKIHKTAIIEEGALIGNDVEIGPYSIIGSKVKIGDGTKIKSHVVIEGNTEIGKNNSIYQFCSIGSEPQDLKYKGENSKIIIGDNNIIREYVTINPGTEGGGMLTKVGNNCLLMISVHIAHDCKVGNNVILANNATLAGHVEVGDFAIIGGLTAVHQFVRIGDHAMIGGMSPIERDVIPYGVALGERASLEGINIVGLKRKNFDRDAINALRECYRIIAEKNSILESLKEIKENFGSLKEVQLLITFLENDNNRSFCLPKNTNK